MVPHFIPSTQVLSIHIRHLLEMPPGEGHATPYMVVLRPTTSVLEGSVPHNLPGYLLWLNTLPSSILTPPFALITQLLPQIPSNAHDQCRKTVHPHLLELSTDTYTKRLASQTPQGSRNGKIDSHCTWHPDEVSQKVGLLDTLSNDVWIPEHLLPIHLKKQKQTNTEWHETRSTAFRHKLSWHYTPTLFHFSPSWDISLQTHLIFWSLS